MRYGIRDDLTAAIRCECCYRGTGKGARKEPRRKRAPSGEPALHSPLGKQVGWRDAWWHWAHYFSEPFDCFAANAIIQAYASWSWPWPLFLEILSTRWAFFGSMLVDHCTCCGQSGSWPEMICLQYSLNNRRQVEIQNFTRFSITSNLAAHI